MNLSTPFIRRPVATTLLTLGLALPAWSRSSSCRSRRCRRSISRPSRCRRTLPGASPETMATTVATPLERHLGQIADVTEMTSSSSVGSTRITLQFGLDRDIDGAARDVQAAINAARADLPTSLRSNPTYRKVNPADAPIMILALTSDTLTPGQIYDAASTVLAAEAVAGRRHRRGRRQRQLAAGGAGRAQSAGAVQVRHRARGRARRARLGQRAQPQGRDRRSATSATRSTPTTRPTRPPTTSSLIVAYRNGAAVRLSDVGEVSDWVENLRNAGLANGKPAVLVILYRQPGANIIDDRRPRQGAAAAAARPRSRRRSTSTSAIDRSTTIRASLHDVERTLLIAIVLVILVVFAVPAQRARDADPERRGAGLADRHLRRHVPARLQPRQSLADGADGRDRLRRRRRDRGAGEHHAPHRGRHVARCEAALQGAREVGFTVLSMSLSLIAVFIPILLMGGIVGRLFREFAMTLSVAILISLVVSLTTTPMMCARAAAPATRGEHGRLYRIERARLRGDAAASTDRTLTLGAAPSALDHAGAAAVTSASTSISSSIVPKGFFPQQDTGRMIGGIQADQSISFQLMQQKLDAVRRHRQEGSGGRHRRRLHRRRPDQFAASCSSR